MKRNSGTPVRDIASGAPIARPAAAGDLAVDAAAEAWLVQARRLLLAMNRPAESARIEATPQGPTVVLHLDDCSTEDADAVLRWAFEAAARVLRGDPQPSDAEVYKAARGLPR